MCAKFTHRSCHLFSNESLRHYEYLHIPEGIHIRIVNTKHYYYSIIRDAVTLATCNPAPVEGDDLRQQSQYDLEC